MRVAPQIGLISHHDVVFPDCLVRRDDAGRTASRWLCWHYLWLRLFRFGHAGRSGIVHKSTVLGSTTCLLPCMQLDCPQISPYGRDSLTVFERVGVFDTTGVAPLTAGAPGSLLHTFRCALASCSFSGVVCHIDVQESARASLQCSTQKVPNEYAHAIAPT